MSPINVAWIGFLGSFVGAFLAALIAIFVMIKTNKVNKNLQIQNQKYIFSNDLADLIGQYCALATQNFIYLKEMWHSVNALSPRLNISNKDYHEERLNKYRDLCELEVSKTDALFFTLEIKLKGVDGAGPLRRRLNDVHENSKKETVGFDDFKEYTAKLMEATAEFIRDYTKSNNNH